MKETNDRLARNVGIGYRALLANQGSEDSTAIG